MFSQAADRIFGENGTVELTSEGVGDSRVALFTSLVRSLADNQMGDLFSQCMADASTQESPQYLADMFVMCMQTRDCRGGKGERDLFYKLLLLLHRDYPGTVHLLLPSIGEYGYYKDFFQILEAAEGAEEHGSSVESLLLLKRPISSLLMRRPLTMVALRPSAPSTLPAKAVALSKLTTCCVQRCSLKALLLRQGVERRAGRAIVS